MVSPLLVFGVFFLLPIGALIFSLMWILPSARPISLATYIIMATMLLALPFFLWLWVFIKNAPIVKIDDKGLHKSLLGRFFKKTILWEEIMDIAVRGNSAKWWIFFSKSNLDGLSMGKCNARRDNISITFSEELKETIKHYSGKEVIVPSKQFF